MGSLVISVLSFSLSCLCQTFDLELSGCKGWRNTEVTFSPAFYLVIIFFNKAFQESDLKDCLINIHTALMPTNRTLVWLIMNSNSIWGGGRV